MVALTHSARCSGEGRGQDGTLWHSPVGAFLLFLLTCLVGFGLDDTLSKHSIQDHLFGMC